MSETENAKVIFSAVKVTLTILKIEKNCATDATKLIRNKYEIESSIGLLDSLRRIKPDQTMQASTRLMTHLLRCFLSQFEGQGCTAPRL